MEAELMDMLDESRGFLDIPDESATSNEGYRKYPALRVFLTKGQKPHRQFLSEEGIVVVGARDSFGGADSAREQSWLQPTMIAFSSLFELSDNWDSYGAKPVTWRAASEAIMILNQNMQPESPAPSIVPMPDGGVQLEWHRGGIDLEIEVTPQGERTIFLLDLQENIQFEGDLDLAKVTVYLERLSR